MARHAVASITADLRRDWRTALRFHVLLRLAGFAVAAPLLTLALRALVAFSGDRVVSNYDIAAFLLTPGGGLFAAGAAVIGVAFMLVELAGLTHIAGSRLAGTPATLGETLAFLIRRAPGILGLAARLCLRVILIVLPFALVAGLVARASLGAHDINYYLSEHPPEWQQALRLGALLGLTAALAVAWQLLRWFLALPALVARPTSSAREALAESARLSRGHAAGILGTLLAWWLCVALVAGLLMLAGRPVYVTLLDWAGMDLRRVLPVVAIGLAVTLAAELLLSGLALAGQQGYAMRRFTELAGGANLAGAAARAGQGPSAARLALRALLVVLAIAAAAAAVSWALLSRMDLRPRVAVTAHRGASIAAPENTMAAFRAAIEAGTDFIELDVQRTADGQIAVLHDGDFMRMAGDPRRIGAVTSADLAGIDIGRRYDPAFAGERAPLLEDVIALVRGKAKLNVELKYNVRDPELAPAVIALLRRERFLDDAVITSLDYAAIKQVEALAPDAVTGHIVTAAVGNVLRTEADFLSLNAAHATVSFVRRAHRAGKGVHVWTVNSRDAMIELAARGVDNIITDDPALFARLRAEIHGLEPGELLGLRLRGLAGRPPPELSDPSRPAPL